MTTLCIDLGGSRAKAAIVTDGNIDSLDVFDVHSDQSMSVALEEIARRVSCLPGIQSCSGLGFAFPGIVDTKRTCVVSCDGKYTNATEADFPRWAKETLGLPMILSNDASAALCGEMAYGVGKGYTDAVLMMIGTGIGTAVYNDGHILLGKHGTLGILGGHIAIAHEKARICTCGNRGCLEAYTGTWALSGIAREEPDFSDSSLSKAEKTDYQALAEGSANGDALCQRLLERTEQALCIGAVNLIHAYDPEILILGGGASRIPGLAETLQTYIDQYAWTPCERVQVRLVKNPETSVVLGLHSLYAGKESRQR